MAAAADTTSAAKARRYLEQIQPKLLEVLAAAPAFGSCGLNLILNNEEITSLDFSMTVKRRLPESHRAKG